MIPDRYEHLADLVRRQLEVFPDHRNYLETRFAEIDTAHLEFCDEVALSIERIAGRAIDRICDDYRWLTGVLLEEELFFRRTGRYRLSTFEEAQSQIYSDDKFMSRYMNGVLASQLWWRNHTAALQFFRDHFIAGNSRDFSHLEVGPGHGLLLYLAASSSGCSSAEAWDVSDTSIAKTKAALTAMGARRDIRLRRIDLFEAPRGTFSSITFSEVLEHLEQPMVALRILHELLSDSGRLYLNAPVNSPAPDHLYLFETPEQIVEMIEEAGFVVEDVLFAPCTGATLDRARKLRLTISAAVIARKNQ